MEEMTLRDKFVCSLVANIESSSPGMTGRIIVAMAYTMADQMLKARSMTKEQMVEWALERADDVV